MFASVRILVVRSRSHFFVLSEDNSKRSVDAAKRKFIEDMRTCPLFEVFKNESWNVFEHHVPQARGRRQYFYAKNKLIQKLMSQGFKVV